MDDGYVDHRIQERPSLKNKMVRGGRGLYSSVTAWECVACKRYFNNRDAAVGHVREEYDRQHRESVERWHLGMYQGDGLRDSLDKILRATQ